MAISSLGIGSGLDLNGILTSLMQAEQQPLVALQKKEFSYQSRISALGTLKGGLSALQTAAQALKPSTGQTAADKYTTIKATTSDTSVATATTASGAVAASYALTDVTLAQAQQVRKSGVDLSIPASGTDGTLSIAIGAGAAVDVAVTGGASLSDIASKINQSSAGVTASVINDGTNDNLVLTAKSSGASNTISVTGSTGWEDFSYASGDVTWTEQQEAKSASLKIDGLLVTSETNAISSAISGVTISLLKESVTGTSLSVVQDKTANLTSALNSFIKAYNASATSMRDLGAYNAETKVAGALQGDSTLRSAQTSVRTAIQTTLGGTSTIQGLSDIGVSLQSDGTLKLDSTKLGAAITSDFASVANLVEKIGSTLSESLNSVVGSTGSIVGATDGANRVIKSLQARQTALTSRLEQTEERYRKQFASLDVMLSSMNQTSNWLTQQLSSLPGAYSGN